MSEALLDTGALPVGACGRRGPGWLGVLGLIVTESAVFAYLLFSYFYFDVQLPRTWRPAELPSLALALPNTLVLLLSSVAVWWSERGLMRGRRNQQLLGLALAILLGLAFVGIQLMEWRNRQAWPSSSAYASLYFTITGFHMAHVLAGLLGLTLVLLWSGLGLFDRRRSAGLSYAAAYWHFVDAVWLCVFFTFYISPRLW
jgi:heme/copper-type cytochrome/quinol oxidase subunit 3